MGGRKKRKKKKKKGTEMKAGMRTELKRAGNDKDENRHAVAWTCR